MLTVDPAVAPVSAIVIHGVKDPTVPYEVNKVLAKGKAGFLPAFDGVKYWLDQDKCAPKGDLKVKQNENIRITTYACQDGAAVQSIAIWNGVHEWFDVKSVKDGKSGIPCNSKDTGIPLAHSRP